MSKPFFYVSNPLNNRFLYNQIFARIISDTLI